MYQNGNIAFEIWMKIWTPNVWSSIESMLYLDGKRHFDETMRGQSWAFSDVLKNEIPAKALATVITIVIWVYVQQIWILLLFEQILFFMTYYIAFCSYAFYYSFIYLLFYCSFTVYSGHFRRRVLFLGCLLKGQSIFRFFIWHLLHMYSPLTVTLDEHICCIHTTTSECFF